MKDPAEAPWVKFSTHDNILVTPGNGGSWALCGSCAAVCWNDAEKFKSSEFAHGCEVFEGDVDLPISEKEKVHIEKLTLSDNTVLTMRFKLNSPVLR